MNNQSATPTDGAEYELKDIRFGRRKLHECDGPDDVTYHEHVAILPDGSKVSLVDFIQAREAAAREKGAREFYKLFTKSVKPEQYEWDMGEEKVQEILADLKKGGW